MNRVWLPSSSVPHPSSRCRSSRTEAHTAVSDGHAFNSAQAYRARLRGLEGHGAFMRNSESVRRHSAGVCTSVTNVLSHVPDDEYARRLRERHHQLATVRDLHRRLWVYLIVVVLT